MDQPLTRRFRLPGDPGAPANARRVLRSTLDEVGLDELADDALLLTSELCENAVLHAGTEFELAITVAGDELTVGVTDHGQMAMELRRGQHEERRATHNRGLMLVDALSTAWGSRHDERGHQVWFTLRPPDRPRPRVTPAAAPGPPRAWPDPTISRWLLHLPAATTAALSLADVVTELLRRLCDVLLADGGSVWVEQGQGAVRLAAYGFADSGGSLTVTLPLAGKGSGKLLVRAPARDPAVTEIAELSAQRIALAIESDRVHIADRERRAWMTYLAEASDLLSLSLDVELTAAIVPQIVVPRLSPWCAVHLLDEQSRLRLVALGHADEAELPAVRESLDGPAARSLHETLRHMLDSGADATGLGPPVGGLAVPLRTGRTVLGTLTVGRPAERVSTPEEVMVISDLARRAAQAIDNAQRHAAHVATSQALQRALLPPALPSADGVRFAAVYQAATAGAEVGGDFYDVLTLGEDRWLVAIGDVCGKGPRAAARTGLVRDTLRVLVRDGQPLARAVELLNELMLEANDPSQFATVALAMISRQPGGRALDVELVLAGHDQPALAGPGGVSLVGAYGTAVGLVDRFAIHPTRYVIEPGDTLVLFTDGVTERRSGTEAFGVEGVTAALADLPLMTADSVVAHLRRTVDAFSAEPQRDDIAIVAVQVPSMP